MLIFFYFGNLNDLSNKNFEFEIQIINIIYTSYKYDEFYTREMITWYKFWWEIIFTLYLFAH